MVVTVVRFAVGGGRMLAAASLLAVLSACGGEEAPQTAEDIAQQVCDQVAAGDDATEALSAAMDSAREAGIPARDATLAAFNRCGESLGSLAPPS